jgi:hypothetical protein
MDQTTTPPVILGLSSSRPLILAAFLALSTAGVQAGQQEPSAVAIAYLGKPLVDSSVKFEKKDDKVIFTYAPANPNNKFTKELPLWTYEVLNGTKQGLIMVRMDRTTSGDNAQASAKLRIMGYHEFFGYKVEEVEIPVGAFDALKVDRVGNNLTALRQQITVTVEGQQLKGEVLALPLTGKVETGQSGSEMQYACFVNVQLPGQFNEQLGRTGEEIRNKIAPQIAEQLGFDVTDIHLTTDPQGLELREIAQQPITDLEAELLGQKPRELAGTR